MNVPAEIRDGLADTLRKSINETNRKNKAAKFGFETSEDALTWTVFKYLQRTGQLSRVGALAGLRHAGDEQPCALALWGVAQDSSARAISENLVSISNRLGEDPSCRSEPDVIIDFGNLGVVVIEVKYRSGNDVLKSSDSRWDKYLDSPGFRNTAGVRKSGLYELARNWRIAWEMSTDRPMALLNLASSSTLTDQKTALHLFQSGLATSDKSRFTGVEWATLVRTVDPMESWFDTYLEKSALFVPARDAAGQLGDAKARGRNIRWIDSRDLDHCGHGVEFFHEEAGDKVLAFLEGYEWQRDPNTVACVRILSSPPESASDALVERWPTLLAEIHVAVGKFLEQPSRRRLRRVRAWFNA